MLLLGAACVCVCAGVCVYPSDYSKSDEEGPALILGYTVTLMVRNLLYKYICLCTYIYNYVRLQILYIWQKSMTRDFVYLNRDKRILRITRTYSIFRDIIGL